MARGWVDGPQKGREREGRPRKPVGGRDVLEITNVLTSPRNRVEGEFP